MLFKVTRAVFIGLLSGTLLSSALVLWTGSTANQYRGIQLTEMNELSRWKLFLFEELGYDYNSFRVMNAIAQCESGWRQFGKDGSLLVSKGNQGIFQINRLAHSKEYERLGIDVSDPYGNIEFAVLLYRSNGIRPWEKWSGWCWKTWQSAHSMAT